ncbi:DUF2218 domain-containing protein [Phenylobacterium sp.]|uniref:DUF2218 domain-containing protein n=1 Tax=Phenylobacterium sp. TaxID=1871053 RepID=UPI002C066862|nr:DUF2218 domain-containing protein [Phenylobacterium sp.]HVI34100.1 DUF2218 domain-containing protein [Phenylobacterium sp.]
MSESRAEIVTPQAGKYLVQLCKHFAHRLPVSHGERAGRIGFPAGDVDLRAEAETLSIALTAPGPAELEALKDVVVRHLVRFAFREELAVAWRDPA